MEDLVPDEVITEDNVKNAKPRQKNYTHSEDVILTNKDFKILSIAKDETNPKNFKKFQPIVRGTGFAIFALLFIGVISFFFLLFRLIFWGIFKNISTVILPSKKK